MSQQHITIGPVNTGGGDTPFAAFTKVEANFNELYSNSPAWGSIATGSGLNSQTDLRTALNTTNFDNYRSLIFPGNSTNTAILFQQIIEVDNGRLFAGISKFGSVLSDFGQFLLSGSYSIDGGKTWGTPYTIVPIEGSEVGNAIPSIWKQSNGTLVMLFWRELQQAINPITTSICKKTSTDNGATWSATTTVYTVGTYSAPAANRIFQANDGTLYYAFNEWTGGPGGSSDFQYGSANAHYKGRLLKSTDDGSTWNFINLQIIDGIGDGVFEPGLFQFPDSGDGLTIGRATFYYRSRNGFVGMAYSDDNFVTWTTGTNSLIPAANHDTHMFYDKQYDVVVGSIPDVAPWAERKVNVWVSYDKGSHYYKKLNLSTIIPTATGWYTAPGAIYNYKGQILFANHQTPTVTGDKWDSYLNYVSLSSLVGINMPAILIGQTQTLTGTTNITTGGGLIFSDLLIGRTTRFNPADLLSVNKVGGDTRIIFSNDDNNGAAKTMLNFRRTRAGSTPSNADPIGEIRWNDKINIIGNQNNNTNAELSFQIDGGVGLVTQTKFTETGQWIYGDAVTLPLRVNGLASYKATARNTEIDLSNVDNNSNFSMIYFQKQRVSSFNLTAGDVVGQLDFNTLAQIKAVANSTVIASFSNIDIAIFGAADITQTVAERARFTSNGNFLIGTTTSNAQFFLNQRTYNTATALPALRIDGGPHLNLTASSEYTDLNFNNSAVAQFAGGALALNRTVRFQPRTLGFVSSSTVTDAINVNIEGAPAAGVNAIFINTHGVFIASNAVSTTASVTNGYGLTVNAPTAALNNYAAQFLGGKVSVQPGTSTYAAKVGGVIFDHFADVATTTSTSETDLYTDTIAANTLTNNGDKLDAEYGLNVTSTGGVTKQIRAYFGGTLIFDTGALSISASTDFCIDILVIRDSSTSVRTVVKATTTGATINAYAKVTKVTGLTLSSTNILKLTGTVGTGAVAGDITIQSGFGEWKPAV